MTARFNGLEYDPETGIFIRTKIGTAGNQRFVGEQAGYLTAKGYRRINIDGKSYSAHILAWFFFYGEWPDRQIDHKNGNKDDNRISNLRKATGSQNRGKLRTNTSGYKGVSQTRRKKPWRADIKHDGRQVYLGSFDTKEEAAEAYACAAKNYHGKFARL